MHVSAKYHLNPVFPSLCVGHWNTRKGGGKKRKKKSQQPLKGIPSEDGMPQLTSASMFYVLLLSWTPRSIWTSCLLFSFTFSIIFFYFRFHYQVTLWDWQQNFKMLLLQILSIYINGPQKSLFGGVNFTNLNTTEFLSCFLTYRSKLSKKKKKKKNATPTNHCRITSQLPWIWSEWSSEKFFHGF